MMNPPRMAADVDLCQNDESLSGTRSQADLFHSNRSTLPMQARSAERRSVLGVRLQSVTVKGHIDEQRPMAIAARRANSGMLGDHP